MYNKLWTVKIMTQKEIHSFFEIEINDGPGCFPSRRSMDNLFKDLEEKLPKRSNK